MFGRSQDTHNLYLEVATNLGIQGLIVFLFFVAKMGSSLNKSINSVIKQKNEIQDIIEKTNIAQQYAVNAHKHRKDLELIEAAARATILFLIVRLALGLFGMDLYEIYWWFSLGLTVSIFNLTKLAALKTTKITKSQ
jgi:putative inorganic carbon (hco3(-)) transporter